MKASALKSEFTFKSKHRRDQTGEIFATPSATNFVGSKHPFYHECVRKAFLSGSPTSEINLWEGKSPTEQKAREGEAPAEPKLSAGREMGR